MWEGVDCSGDILSSAIIVRLPFPLRSQSMEYKRSKCASTSEFIQTYAVPQMIIKLRQGAGRLIRTETDTGVLSILDSRAAADGAYRSRVLAALGKYPLVSSIQEIAAFIDSVKDDTYTKEGSI
jgi:ATP-dependent DNA helicase DinG